MFANQQQIVLTVISLNLFAKHGTSSRFLLPLQPVQKISGGKDCGSFIWPVWVLVSCSVSKLPFLLRQPPTQISFVIPNMGLPVKPIWKLPRNSNDFYKCRGLSPPNLSSLLPLQILSIPLMVSAVPSSVVMMTPTPWMWIALLIARVKEQLVCCQEALFNLWIIMEQINTMDGNYLCAILLLSHQGWFVFPKG